MVTKIKQWGNGQGVHLDNDILREARISVGDDVRVSVRDGMIVIAPVRHIRGRYSLRELVSRIPKDHPTKEADWHTPVGEEEERTDR